MISYLLFLNDWEGLGYLLKKRIQKESLDIPYFNLKDNLDEFRKYEIRSSPVLLILDKEEIADKLTSVEEIVEYLKNVSNTKIPLGDKT